MASYCEQCDDQGEMLMLQKERIKDLSLVGIRLAIQDIEDVIGDNVVKPDKRHKKLKEVLEILEKYL